LRWLANEEGFSFGAGIKELLNDDFAEQILNSSEPTGPYDEAAFKIDTFATAEEGKTISGDDL